MVSCIIAGPRDFNDYEILLRAIEASSYSISEIISGCAKGVDSLGERYAKENDIPIKSFPAEWNNLKQPGAIVKKNSWGKKYNANAGFYRNSQMVEYAKKKNGALIAIDTGSYGTADTIKKAKEAGLQIFIFRPDDHLKEEDYAVSF